MNERFDDLLSYVTPAIASSLYMISEPEKALVTELRLRLGAPVALTLGNSTRFLSRDGKLSLFMPSFPVLASSDNLTDSYLLVCSHSVHTHGEELGNGFITLPGGHRVGIVGDGVEQAGRIQSFRQVTALNYRFSHEIIGAAEPLRPLLFSTKGLLICGAPSTGKTTVLRDAVRMLSLGDESGSKRICLVDSRRELSGFSKNKYAYSLGPSTDVLLCQATASAIQIALRVMNPEYLVCDEIVTEEETAGLMAASGCGVRILASLHAGSLGEARERPIAKQLITCGAVRDLVFLPAIGAKPIGESAKGR